MNFIKRRVRIFFWTFQSLFSRHNKLIVGGVLLGFVLVLFFWKIYPYLTNFFPKEKTIIGVIGLYEPNNLPLNIQKKISLGLTNITASGDAEPLIAESWKTDQDGRRYFFSLRKDIFWHDGEPFTAYDVNYNFKNVFINAADRNTLKIELPEPYSPLPTLLSKPIFKKGLIGLGEYKVASLKLKENKLERLVLKPVDSKNSKPSLEYRFFPDTKTAVIAFKLGELDVLEGMFLKKYLSEEKNVRIIEEPINNLALALFFNFKNNLLREKEVRQALSFSTPSLEGKPVFSTISENSWAYNAQIKQYKFNLDLAKSILNSDTKTATQTGELNLYAFPEYADEAQKIVDSWTGLGIQTHVRVVYFLPDDFDVFLGLLEIPPDPDQYSLWHSTQAKTNITSYNNPKIDKLLEDGRKTTNKEERQKIYWDFQKYLAEDAPAKFISNPIMYTATRK